MSQRETLKLVHFGSTFWFMLCVGYILALMLRQAGFNWWIIFSLSGHSVLLIFLLISLYLFAIFKGASRSHKIEVEHPLTSTNHYMVFYLIVPFLGSLAGFWGMIGVNTTSQFLYGIVLGTLGTTFLVWVILDPLMILAETLLPSSRKHRSERLAQIKIERQKRQMQQKRLWAEILDEEERNQRRWRQVLQPEAEKLAGLSINNITDFNRAELEAIDIGVNAWQIGGLSCMRQLRDMSREICKKKKQDLMIIDYISTWWDGIGQWQNPSLG
ncbi:MAG: hypothetical protein ACYS9Y_04695 [Planctomycetota bacterium]|jgi:hypothetical protein